MGRGEPELAEHALEHTSRRLSDCEAQATYSTKTAEQARERRQMWLQLGRYSSLLRGWAATELLSENYLPPPPSTALALEGAAQVGGSDAETGVGAEGNKQLPKQYSH